jgi:hypothetical protein
MHVVVKASRRQTVSAHLIVDRELSGGQNDGTLCGRHDTPASRSAQAEKRSSRMQSSEHTMQFHIMRYMGLVDPLHSQSVTL